MANENPKQKSRLALVVILFLIEAAGIGVSIYLTWIKYHFGNNPICDISSKFSCSAVAASRYSAIIGIPIAYFGILTYIVCVVLTALGMKPEKSRFHAHIPNYLLAISSWCVVYSIFLALISTLVIKSICTFCVALYVVNIGLFVCSIIWSGDVPEGRFAPLLGDIKDGVKIPQVWGVVIAIAIVLVISGLLFSRIKPPPPPQGIYDLAGHPMKGDQRNPVQVIEVSDPKCPWCAKAHRVIKEAETTYGDKFYVAFVFYPLEMECNETLKRTIHPQACLGSYAARCAKVVGDDAKFWEYMDMLFERQTEEWTAETLTNYSREIGLDENRFKQCLSDPDTIKYIKSDVEQCEKNGVHGTPVIYFNGKESGGVTSGVPAFMEYLQEALSPKPPSTSSAPATAEQSVAPTAPGK